jgi:hypothetical protein
LDSLDGSTLEKIVRRIIVLGGLGHFGHAAAEQLGAFSLPFKVASRRGGAGILINANDASSIRAVLQPNDIVIDAAGPFHTRNTSLVETAIEVGFDVIDINDDLSYAERVLELAPRIEAAGIRVLTSSSTVSAVATAVVRHSGIARPRSVTTFLAPASRRTANAGAALSLLRCVGRRVRVLCDGRLQDFPGWSYPRSFRMPRPLGAIRGRLFESADAVHLPRIWSSLRDVAMYVDTNTLGANAVLQVAARSPALRRLLERHVRWGAVIARMFGSSAGGVGYEIEGASGQIVRAALVARENSYVVAVAPAVLAAQALAEDRFSPRGLVSPDQHVDPSSLFTFLQSKSIQLQEVR